MNPNSDGWAPYLDPGETILWQGQPDGRVVLKIGNIAVMIFGLFFAGFALVWMVMAAGAGGFFWAFGLIHFSVGVGIVFGSLFFPAIRRRNSFYTLTSARAFIATSLPFAKRSLRSYPIAADTTLVIEAGKPGSVYFAEELRRQRNSSHHVRVGFERIADAEHVYGLMRQIQRGQHENAD